MFTFMLGFFGFKCYCFIIIILKKSKQNNLFIIFCFNIFELCEFLPLPYQQIFIWKLLFDLNFFFFSFFNFSCKLLYLWVLKNTIQINYFNNWVQTNHFNLLLIVIRFYKFCYFYCVVFVYQSFSPLTYRFFIYCLIRPVCFNIYFRMSASILVLDCHFLLNN